MPMHDARTNPLGMGLTIEAWPRDRRLRQLARQRGLSMPSPDRVAADAKPARLVIDHGILKAWCTDCIGAAEDIWRDRPVMFCMRCGNATAGGLWRPVIVPDNLAEIEALLETFPSEMRNWEPWGPPRDLAAEVADWLAHAAVTVDPDHGLTDNAVRGADDPEIWTAPFIATTNAIIASSDCNAGYRGNLLWLRQFLSGNPSGAGYVVESSGADAGSWVQVNQAKIISWLGYTPLNRAGGSMTGNIAFADDTEGVSFADGSAIRGNVGAAEMQTFADKWVLYNEAGSQVRATITNLVAAFLGAVSGASASFTGAISAASAAISGAITAASLATTGNISSSGGAVSASGNVSGNRLVANVADGATPPVVIDAAQAGVTNPNLRAASSASADNASQLGGVAAASYTRIIKGTYTGTGTDGRNVTVGFTCQKVEIYLISSSVVICHVFSTTAGGNVLCAFNGSVSLVSSSQNTHLNASDGFNVSASGTNDLNVNGIQYGYVAYK